MGARLLQTHLTSAGNPEAGYFFDTLAAIEMRVGVGIKMPRARTIFKRKTKGKPDELEVDFKPEGTNNYISAKERPEVLEKQFEEDTGKERRLQKSIQEARESWGDDVLGAALTAIEKKPDSDEWMIFLDGTHGIMPNHRIRVRDQLEYPSHADAEGTLGHLKRTP